MRFLILLLPAGQAEHALEAFVEQYILRGVAGYALVAVGHGDRVLVKRIRGFTQLGVGDAAGGIDMVFTVLLGYSARRSACTSRRTA